MTTEIPASHRAYFRARRRTARVRAQSIRLAWIAQLSALITVGIGVSRLIGIEVVTWQVTGISGMVCATAMLMTWGWILRRDALAANLILLERRAARDGEL